MRKLSSVLVAAPLASLLAAATAIATSAHATGSPTRTFVSSSGIDSNPCTIAAPCASFAAAYAAVAANGIIAALDPGKYGPLTNITTGVTINGNGWSAITAPANGVGLTINAGTANVTLIGLEIDGAAAAYNGILLNSAGSLTVTNCTLQNFIQSGNNFTTGNGILLLPASGTLDFTITNTTASNNAFAGIAYYPAGGSPNANGVIDHVVANANVDGIFVNTSNASGGTTILTVSNSATSDNSAVGITAVGETGTTIKLTIDRATTSGNGTGVYAQGTANVLLGRSVVTGNGTGISNSTSPSTVYSYGDNRINLNGSGSGDDIVTNALNTFPQQ
jgi:hypothetical protein